jgi:signal transduction histidine kinase
MLALQLVGREKEAVVGTLAAGVAHEVKNPLNAIINAGRVLQKGTRTPELDNKLTGVIVDAASRIDTIVDALDTHTRPADSRGWVPFDPRSGLDSSLLLLEHRMGHVKVNREYADVPKVEADARAINQVILNLIDNAVRSSAKEIWLGVSLDGDGVTVRVADDGKGVDPANEKKIFDPFFTTREPGVGTGLGLHLAKQTIARHRGKLWYERRPGGGAIFQFKLPLQAQPE